MTKPVFSSLNGEFAVGGFFDIDVYKLFMLYFVWCYPEYANAPVRFAFKNRGDVRILDFVDMDEMQAQFAYAQLQAPTSAEIEKLKKHSSLNGLFPNEFWEFVADMLLPDLEIKPGSDGNPIIHASGPEAKVMFWETKKLQIIQFLYQRALAAEQGLDWRKDVWNEGDIRLTAKFELLRANKSVVGPIADFCTRRRPGYGWHRHVLQRFADELPELYAGTSNVQLALELGHNMIGTNAHELPMLAQGVHHLEDDKAGRLVSQDILLKRWDETFHNHPHLLLFLTDTPTTPAFLREVPEDLARRWRGQRQDSGKPEWFADTQFIPFYQGLGIDPCEKICVFSDGLKARRIIDISHHCHGRMTYGFGWGTNLGNDLGFDLRPLPIVSKLVMACGWGTCKLSDTEGKVTGTDESVERYARLAGADLGTRVDLAIEV